MNEEEIGPGERMVTMVNLVGKPLVMEVLVALSRRPFEVGELADHLQLDVTAVSRTLRQLFRARYAKMHREKTRHVYAIGPDLTLMHNGTVAYFVARSTDGAEMTLRVPRELIPPPDRKH